MKCFEILGTEAAIARSLGTDEIILIVEWSVIEDMYYFLANAFRYKNAFTINFCCSETGEI